MKKKFGTCFWAAIALAALLCIPLSSSAAEKAKSAEKAAEVKSAPAEEKANPAEKAAEVKSEPADEKANPAEKAAEVKPEPADEKANPAEEAAEVKPEPADEKANPAEKAAEVKPAEEKELSENIAVVNGKGISRKDFEKEIGAMRQRMMMQGQQVDETQLAEIQKNLLEMLINRELLYQESRKSGKKVEESAVNEEFSKWKKQFPDEAQFKNIMTMMNLSEDSIKEQIRQRISVQQLIEKEISPKIKVSEEEIKAFYDKNNDAFKQPEEVKASHILVKVDGAGDAAKKAEARKKIEEIQGKLKKGEDFATLAKANSDCPSKDRGGDLGAFGRGEMDKTFEDAAFALKPGEVSDIVETKFGFHLIKSSDKKAEKTLSYEEVKERISERLKQEKEMNEATQYSEKLKATAKIEKFLE
jgi:peptidyl-prolyl cis-trans isomerase C